MQISHQSKAFFRLCTVDEKIFFILYSWGAGSRQVDDLTGTGEKIITFIEISRSTSSLCQIKNTKTAPGILNPI